MTQQIHIKRGLDIPLAGEPGTSVTDDTLTGLFAIYPDDFPGVTWKVLVHPGDTVECGTALCCSKEDSGLCLTSPVAGTVQAVQRGERRHVQFISVLRQGDQTLDFSADTGDVRRLMCRSGLWAMMRQRPYDIVPRPDARPRDIFVTAFDSSPLAAPMLRTDNLTAVGHLATGLKALAQLTEGNLYLAVRPGTKANFTGVETITVSGPHPAGNTGPQIAAVRPVNKGETVFTLDIITALRLGILLDTGRLDTTADVAVTGSEAKDPHMIKTHIGAKLQTLLEGQLKSPADTVRVVSGNVLTGIRCDLQDGFLHFPWRQVTMLPEGDRADEFMGWASLSPAKYSVKHTFLSWLAGKNKRFDIDARIKGGRRFMIMSEEYDRVFPFDIYPEYLLRAIMAGDLERMEELGAYEVAPEDFALAEFVDTSKIPLQQTVRDGLDMMRRELS